MARRIRVADRWTEVPEDVISAEELRRLGGIPSSRTLVRRTQDGAYLVPPRSRVRLIDGDEFDDAPARIKGA